MRAFDGDVALGTASRTGRPIAKYATGIRGFDDITGGGLPVGRLTAVIGAAGAGKTVFALQTMINLKAATGQDCIFVAFEEPIDRIQANAASFDWDEAALEAPAIRFVDARMPQDAIISGAFDLSGLLAGLTARVEDGGVGGVIFDGVDRLLDGLRDEQLERRELERLETWIRDSGLSAIITIKAFGGASREQRRADFIQYMTDCVIVLSATITQTEASRTLRVAKYRGSAFTANPAPVVIGPAGYEVVVVNADRANHPTFDDRLSSGVARLDALMAGGYLRGNSVLVSGAPGTTKTSLAASFAEAACARGERVLFVTFDESGDQIVANMKSIGLALRRWVEAELLIFAPLFSASRSAEEHYAKIRDLIEAFAPQCLIIDPISSFMRSGYPFSEAICGGLLDFAKSLGVTALLTSLLERVDGAEELSASHISTIADSWIHVSNLARDGERNRALTIVKSRGTAHSNQVRELVVSAHGIDLVDVYVAEGEVLMGSARAQKEVEAERRETLRDLEARHRRLDIEAEILALKDRVGAATRALDLKQREAEAMGLADAELVDSLRAAAARRIELRRPDLERAAPLTGRRVELKS